MSIMWGPLHEACRTGDHDLLRYLLSSGYDLNEADILNSWTPLHVAASSDHLKCVKLLLHAGATVSLADRFGHTCRRVATGFCKEFFSSSAWKYYQDATYLDSPISSTIEKTQSMNEGVVFGSVTYSCEYNDKSGNLKVFVWSLHDLNTRLEPLCHFKFLKISAKLTSPGGVKLRASSETISLPKSPSSSEDQTEEDQDSSSIISLTSLLPFKNITPNMVENQESMLEIDVNAKHTKLWSFWNVVSSVKMPLKTAVMKVMKEKILLRYHPLLNHNKLSMRLTSSKTPDENPSESTLGNLQSNNCHAPEAPCLTEEFSWTEYLLNKQQQAVENSRSSGQCDALSETESDETDQNSREHDDNLSIPSSAVRQDIQTRLTDLSDCLISSISSSSSSSSSFSSSHSNLPDSAELIGPEECEELDLNPKLVIDCDQLNYPIISIISHCDKPIETRLDLSNHISEHSTKILIHETEDSFVTSSSPSVINEDKPTDHIVLQLGPECDFEIDDSSESSLTVNRARVDDVELGLCSYQQY